MRFYFYSIIAFDSFNMRKRIQNKWKMKCHHMYVWWILIGRFIAHDNRHFVLIHTSVNEATQQEKKKAFKLSFTFHFASTDFCCCRNFHSEYVNGTKKKLHFANEESYEFPSFGLSLATKKKEINRILMMSSRLRECAHSQNDNKTISNRDELTKKKMLWRSHYL